MNKKTLMPEVLPGAAQASTRSPRDRARARLEHLAKKALLAGAAGSLSACVGYGVVDPLPPPPPDCTPQDDPNQWATASLTSIDPLIVVLALNTFNVNGVTLATEFTAEGASVANTTFDTGDLASATSVTVELTPQPNVTQVILHTGLSCAGVGRAVDVAVDLATGQTLLSAR